MDKLGKSVPSDPTPDRSALSRRHALVGAGTAGALAAAAVALPIKTGDSAEPAPATASTSGDPHGRYQETEHVRRYYATTRV